MIQETERQRKMNGRTALVAGSSGFIGGHLVRQLKSEGYFVLGADIESPCFEQPDRFYHFDLRRQSLCEGMFFETEIHEVYNLAAMMGGMGYIGNEAEHAHDIMTGSSLIIANLLDCCVNYKVRKVFYASSACVYNMHKQAWEDVTPLKEGDAYPAQPDLVYGWQKLFGEQMHLAALQSKGLEVRIARFHNVFGPEGIYKGGKEKAPGALARKVAMAQPGENIEVWGTGRQQRSFLYIEECIKGIRKLMNSDVQVPVNIGSEERVTINELAERLIKISGKNLTVKNVESPNIGVASRTSDNSFISELLGWKPQERLQEGLETTYKWINTDILNRRYND